MSTQDLHGRRPEPSRPRPGWRPVIEAVVAERKRRGDISDVVFLQDFKKMVMENRKAQPLGKLFTTHYFALPILAV